MSLRERVILFIEHKNLNKAEFERLVGLSNDAVSKMTDNTRKSTLDKISKIFPELNIAWLKTGEGEMIKSGDVNIKGDSNIGNTGLIGGDINSTTQLLKKRIAELEKTNKELTELLKSTSSMEDEFERLFSGREIARLEKENKQLTEENKRLIEDSGYYKGLLDKHGIDYKRAV